MTLWICWVYSWVAFFFAPPEIANPLESFSPVWKDPKYRACNTALKSRYLSKLEKDVVFILNMARQNPQQFNHTVVAKWPDEDFRDYLKENSYFKSLRSDLAQMKPAGMLQPDSLAWVSAYCHAASSGKLGFVGHERQTETCKMQERFGGECCQYGYATALEIVMSLLIDKDVPSLGHRVICLSPGFKGIGVSHQPHKEYGFNTVLDFTR